MKLLYLLINAGSALVPFIYSFHRKIKFSSEFRAAFSAIGIVALVFVIWDAYFTYLGVWGFNDDYITGFRLYNLPLEEILFFLCIPFSCLFTYYTLSKNVFRTLQIPFIKPLVLIIALFFFSIAVPNYDRLYTFWAFFPAAVLLLVLVFFAPNLLSSFLLSYLILMVPFFIVNGILTGTGIENEVVWYNNNENLGLRVITIPVEDFSYGLSMILLNILVFERIRLFRSYALSR